MTIRLQVALAVLGSSCVGLALAIWLAVCFHGRAAERAAIGPDFVACQDVRRAVDSLGNFLVTADLVIGSGETHLADGGVRQATQVRAVLAELCAASLAQPFANELLAIDVGVQRLAGRVQQAAVVDGADRDARLAHMLTEHDHESTATLAALQRICQELPAAAERRRVAADAAIADLMQLTHGLGCIYAALVGAVFLASTRQIVGPIQQLSAATAAARTGSAPIAVAPAGPREVRTLISDVTEFATRLRSEKERIESIVRERTAELVAAIRTKDEFLAMMSHELRTPLNGVLGMLQLAETYDLEDELRQDLRIAEEAGEHLLCLLNSILDYAKIQAGHLEISTTPTDAANMVRGVVAQMSPLARGKGLRLTAEVDTAVPHLLDIDAMRLRQVLLNLVGNAVKFTDSGAVVVRLRAQGLRDGKHRLHFEVQDSGIGMTAQQQQRLFEPFVQGDASITRRFGGTGLGLCICKSIVEAMGGSITCTSELKRGTTFAFGICAVTSTAREVGQLPPVVNADCHRLVGMAAVEAEAKGAAQRSTAANATDGVGAASGRDAAARARTASEATVAPTQHIAPSRATGRAAEGATAPPAPMPEHASPRRVLVAEDEPTNREVMERFLKDAGAIATFVGDGAAAVAAARNAAFDLMLMDLRMPKLDGIAATIEIRRLERTGQLASGSRRPLPIVAVTAHVFEDDRQRCRTAGMNAVLGKPLRYEELLAAMAAADAALIGPAP